MSPFPPWPTRGCLVSIDKKARLLLKGVEALIRLSLRSREVDCTAPETQHCLRYVSNATTLQYSTPHTATSSLCNGNILFGPS